jgi:hypothetical protein
MIIKYKKGDYNYDKWVVIADKVGITDQDNRDWLINFLQQMEDNANRTIPNFDDKNNFQVPWITDDK